MRDAESEPKLSFNKTGEQTIEERMENMTEKLDSNSEEESFDEDKQDGLAIN